MRKEALVVLYWCIAGVGATASYLVNRSDLRDKHVEAVTLAPGLLLALMTMAFCAFYARWVVDWKLESLGVDSDTAAAAWLLTNEQKFTSVLSDRSKYVLYGARVAWPFQFAFIFALCFIASVLTVQFDLYRSEWTFLTMTIGMLVVPLPFMHDALDATVEYAHLGRSE